MKKYFVMSDIHSFYYEMMSALEQKGFEYDNPDHIVIVCGDLFDRGDQAKQCFRFVQEMFLQRRLVYIFGNHEGLLLECIGELTSRGVVYNHHVQNKTIDTVAQLSGINRFDLQAGFFDREQLEKAMKPFVDFMALALTDYFEKGDYVFCHAWVPCEESGLITDNWRDGDWSQARWPNGMWMWYKGREYNTNFTKTIVCGHWHTSWGHCYLHRDGTEFPHQNTKNWQKSFAPFVDEGIIAIDACTAYTGFCNCVVFDETDDGKLSLAAN